mgnify:CR=1 FL=1
MAESNKNLIMNGDFSHGLTNWLGRNIRLVGDPLSKSDLCILMGNKNTLYNPGSRCVLRQKIRGSFVRGSSYSLRYELMYALLVEPTYRLYVKFSYLDDKGRIIHSTQIPIVPDHTTLRWFPYTIDVPSIPGNTNSLGVSFLIRGGIIYVNNIQLVDNTGDVEYSEDEESGGEEYPNEDDIDEEDFVEEYEVEDEDEENAQIINPDAI